MQRATSSLLVPLCAAFGAGCVTLGPTPGLTFTSAVPASRPGAEVSAAIVPGYYLSNAVIQPTQLQPEYGSPMLQVSLLVDPSTLLANSGLSAGLRVVNFTGGDRSIEPMLRWRRSFFDHDLLSVGAALSGTYASYRDETNPPLSYRAGRGSLEAGGEFRLTPPWWVELRAMGGGGATALSASGTWCAGPNSASAVPCPTDGSPVLNVSSSAMGVYWSGYGGLAVDVARPLDGFFHFARVAGVLATGTVPTTVPPAAQPGITQSVDSPVSQGPDATWAFWGVSVTLAFGAPREPSTPAAAPPQDPANVRGQVRGEGGAPVAGATVQVGGGEADGDHGWQR